MKLTKSFNFRLFYWQHPAIDSNGLCQWDEVLLWWTKCLQFETEKKFFSGNFKSIHADLIGISCVYLFIYNSGHFCETRRRESTAISNWASPWALGCPRYFQIAGTTPTLRQNTKILLLNLIVAFQSCDLSILEEPWNPFELPPLSFDSAELDIFDNQHNQHQNLVLSNEPLFEYKDMIHPSYNDTKSYQVC